MPDDISRRIRKANRGNKGQLLTEHLVTLVHDHVWQPGHKAPSSRKIAHEYGVSLETARGALRELQGRGLIRIRPRSGAVVCEGPAATASSSAVSMRCIAYVRLLDVSPQVVTSSIPGDEILAGLERGLLKSDYHTLLISERHDSPTRVDKLVSRLANLGPSLAGVVMLRPPSDVYQGLTKLLDAQHIPWLVVGRSTHVTHQCISPDYVHMGQLVGRYLAACGARNILFLTRPLATGEHVSGIEKMEGLVGGYLQAGKPSPVITPLVCDEVDDKTSYLKTLDYLKQGHRPDAIIGYGDRMSFGAIVACRETGLRMPRDVSVLGTTGTAAATYFDPPVTVADQQLSQLAATTTSKLLEMIDAESQSSRRRESPQGSVSFQSIATPVKLVIRKSSKMNKTIASALAADIDADHVVIES